MQLIVLSFALLSIVSAFDTPYDPTKSRQFDAAKSTTFQAHVETTFDLSYADTTRLHGFAATDYVELGQFRAQVPVGIITDCNSPDFNGVDGILGFGCKKRRANLPMPLFWAMTDPNNMNSNARHIQRKFSFFSSQDAAELQLGGYDPETVEGDLYFVPTSSPTDFIIEVSSLRFGDPSNPGSALELLQFSEMYKSGLGGKQPQLPGILDSGTSCLVMPDSTLDGTLTDSPFAKFAANWATGKSFWITINGKDMEIPFSSWFLMHSNETCVQQTPAGMNGLLIGDVFFRSWLVLFDMTVENAPVVGIGKLNQNYVPVKESVSGFYTLEQNPVAKFPVKKVTSQTLSQMVQGVPEAAATEVDQIPVFNKKGTQYFVDLKMGSPPQPFTVIFDTGSSVFGVFVKKDALPVKVRDELRDGRVLSEVPGVSLEQMKESFSRSTNYLLDLDTTSMAFTLVAINGVALAGVIYVRQKMLNRKRSLASQQENFLSA